MHFLSLSSVLVVVVVVVVVVGLFFTINLSIRLYIINVPTFFFSL